MAWRCGVYKGSKDIFTNRYRIAGLLTAQTPLHVGDGDPVPLRGRIQVREGDREPRYSSFFSGANNTIFIPGSTLKGVIRAWLETYASADPDVMNAVFGTQMNGGKAEFHDAPLVQAAQPANEEHRWWEPERGTCLAPGVALNPSTRTAEEHLLYYIEYAPEGSSFQITITAQNLEPAERDLLRSALDAAFGNGQQAARVGAGVANGWGAMSWMEASCTVLDLGDAKQWLENGAAEPYHTIFRADPAPIVPLPMAGATPALLLDITLQFEGAVLVNDPSQARHTNEAAGEEGVGHATVRHIDGRPVLPASSVRGALRAQTRRIWQTLAHGTAQHLPHGGRAEAKRSGDVVELAPFYRVFGAPGWRAPIDVSDFELIGDASEHGQEFVAIDRFTGGAAESKKFRATGLYAPDFRGTVRVDLGKWERAQVGGWAILAVRIPAGSRSARSTRSPPLDSSCGPRMGASSSSHWPCRRSSGRLARPRVVPTNTWLKRDSAKSSLSPF